MTRNQVILRVAYICFSSCLLLSQPSWATEPDDSQRAAAIAAIDANRDSAIALLELTWGMQIESEGGHPSQLTSTLRAAKSETLLKLGDAVSLEEINLILLGD